ncbi:MAG: polysaccharide pyruvyl transferase family protein [Lachnospiraceae bacterium]|nr:polysaccharide pyruvyl transferase family protein [Lachnospiraceae bacterium]
MNILITGAQFENKGAQSLLFSLISEIRNKYPDRKIVFYYVPVDDITAYDVKKYRFKFVYDDCFGKDCSDILRIVHRTIKGMKRILQLRKKIRKKEILRLSKCWGRMDLHLDISGYSLSSKWPAEINNRLLRYINGSASRNVPVILMPQSFGPFDFITSKDSWNKRIRQSLRRADVICAREKDGKEMLSDIYGIRKNVFVYPDLVLSSGEVKPKNIFKKHYDKKEIVLDTINNVGIIPNHQLLTENDEEKILEMYRNIIIYLLDKGKNVYVFRHSNDLEMCEKICKKTNDQRVKLISDDFDCLEFSAFVKQFDYVIASRFHSIVHSFKNSVPAIIIGWSVKYNELADLFGQQKYVLDIDDGMIEDTLIKAVDNMDEYYCFEKKKIKEALNSINSKSCYEKVWKIIDNIPE